MKINFVSHGDQDLSACLGISEKRWEEIKKHLGVIIKNCLQNGIVPTVEETETEYSYRVVATKVIEHATAIAKTPEELVLIMMNFSQIVEKIQQYVKLVTFKNKIFKEIEE